LPPNNPNYGSRPQGIAADSKSPPETSDTGQANQQVAAPVSNFSRSSGNKDASSNSRGSKSGKQTEGGTQTGTSGDKTAANPGTSLPLELNSLMLGATTMPMATPPVSVATEELKSTTDLTVLGNVASLSAVSAGSKSPGNSAAKIPGQAAPNNPLAGALGTIISKQTSENPTATGEATAANIPGLTPAPDQATAMVKPPASEVNTGKSTANPLVFDPLAGTNSLSTSPSDADGQTPSMVIGTSSALMAESMNTGEKTDKTADQNGKLLPGSVSVVAHGNDLPSSFVQSTSTTSANLINPSDTSSASLSSADGAASLSASDLRLQTLERTHELVADNAMRPERSGSDTLTVVIKPGGGTQLSLELRQHGDGVEAQASLQQGDYHHLNQNWSDLQQRLEQRGIRLAPLVDGGSFTNSGNEQSGKSPARPSETLADLDLSKPLNPTLTSQMGRTRMATGWETWA
jgi:hypothetical protein